MAVGICTSGMNGPVALNWSELKSYCQLTQTELEPWECETLIELSRSYVSFYHKAKEPSTPPPFVTDDPIALARHELWVIDKDNERDAAASRTERLMRRKEKAPN
jgi:hypothetical protein